MSILLIDTAFDTCQAGLWRDGELLAAAALPGEARHDVMLAPLVAQLLHDHDLTPTQLSGVAVVTGPGRFTSLRVGIAFARALVLPHAIPLAGITTGSVLQRMVPADHAWLVMVKRGEFFVQTPAMQEPLNLSFDQWPGWLSAHPVNGLTVIGAGVPTDWDALLGSDIAYTVCTSLPLPVMGEVAAHALKTGQGAGTAHDPVRPFYGNSTGAWA